LTSERRKSRQNASVSAGPRSTPDHLAAAGLVHAVRDHGQRATRVPRRGDDPHLALARVSATTASRSPVGTAADAARLRTRVSETDPHAPAVAISRSDPSPGKATFARSVFGRTIRLNGRTRVCRRTERGQPERGACELQAVSDIGTGVRAERSPAANGRDARSRRLSDARRIRRTRFRLPPRLSSHCRCADAGAGWSGAARARMFPRTTAAVSADPPAAFP